MRALPRDAASASRVGRTKAGGELIADNARRYEKWPERRIEVARPPGDDVLNDWGAFQITKGHIGNAQLAHRFRHQRDAQVLRNKADDGLLKLRLQPDRRDKPAGTAIRNDRFSQRRRNLGRRRDQRLTIKIPGVDDVTGGQLVVRMDRQA